jgi:hypothetical protein
MGVCCEWSPEKVTEGGFARSHRRNLSRVFVVWKAATSRSRAPAPHVSFGGGSTAVQDVVRVPHSVRGSFARLERPLLGPACARRRPAGVLSRPGRFPRMDRDDPTPVDLLEEIRAALDGVDPLLCGRVVDIEMARLRVLTDPTLFRRVFAGLIGAAVAQTEPPNSITVRVARTGKTARIEVINEGSAAAHGDFEDVTAEAEELRAIGGEIGATGPVGTAAYWMTLPLAPGTSSAADA